MRPVVVLPPATPSTSHVTLVLLLPVTVGVNVIVWPGVNPPRFGAIVTETFGAGVMVTLAVSDFVLSATEIAFTVTGFDAGTVVGAVKSPVALIVPAVELPPVTLFTCHVTAVFDVFVTVAVNRCAWPVCTLAVAGVTCTEIGVTALSGPAHAASATATAMRRNCRTKRELATTGLYVFMKLRSTLAVGICRGHKRKPAGRVFYNL